MNFTIEIEQEEDGRWLGEVLELPGVLVYGDTRDEAISHAQALALRVVADRLEHGEAVPLLLPHVSSSVLNVRGCALSIFQMERV